MLVDELFHFLFIFFCDARSSPNIYAVYRFYNSCFPYEIFLESSMLPDFLFCQMLFNFFQQLNIFSDHLIISMIFCSTFASYCKSACLLVS